MAKSLSQITFEFEAGESVDPVAPVAEGTVVNVSDVDANARDHADHSIITDTVSPSPAKPSGRGRRSLQEQAPDAGMMDIPEDEQLFSKQYYSMGEVAAMFRENQSLIRFWETEFDILKPRKNRKGDRFFRPEDVKNLVLIYDLLRRRKFTIEGAKEYLRNNKRAEAKFEMIQSLGKIRSFLLELKASL